MKKTKIIAKKKKKKKCSRRDNKCRATEIEQTHEVECYECKKTEKVCGKCHKENIDKNLCNPCFTGNPDALVRTQKHTYNCANCGEGSHCRTIIHSCIICRKQVLCNPCIHSNYGPLPPNLRKNELLDYIDTNIYKIVIGRYSKTVICNPCRFNGISNKISELNEFRNMAYKYILNEYFHKGLSDIIYDYLVLM